MSWPAARPVLLGVAAAYGIGVLLVALYLVRDVLVLAFIAWIVAAALRPPVEWLVQRLPRALSIALVYLGVILVFALLMVLVVPPLARELYRLADQLPEYVGRLQAGLFQVQAWLAQFGISIEPAQTIGPALSFADDNLGALLRVPAAALRTTLAFLAVLVLSFYWLLSRKTVIEWLISFAPAGYRDTARDLFDRAEGQMGAYVRGLAILMAAVGVATYAGLLALGVPFALALAVIAGILEILPNVGPILSAVPAVIVAATQSPVLALATAGLYLLVQQLENYLLVPKVQGKAVGLHPLAILLAVLLGGSLAGLAGAVLAVPIAALLDLVLTQWRQARMDRERAQIETPREP